MVREHFTDRDANARPILGIDVSFEQQFSHLFAQLGKRMNRRDANVVVSVR